MEAIELVLYGPVPSKKNRYWRDVRGRPFKDEALRRAIDSLIMQVPPSARLRLEHPDIEIEFGFERMNQDRDNALTTILDVLVEAGVLLDDRTSVCNGLITILPARRASPPYTWIRVRPRRSGTDLEPDAASDHDASIAQPTLARVTASYPR